MTIKHAFTSNKSDGTDNSLVKPSDWNADHVITDIVAVIGTFGTTYQAILGDAIGAGDFEDGSNYVTLADGTYAIIVFGQSYFFDGMTEVYFNGAQGIVAGYDDFTAVLASDVAGAIVSDGTNTVNLADGIYAINATGIIKSNSSLQIGDTTLSEVQLQSLLALI